MPKIPSTIESGFSSRTILPPDQEKEFKNWYTQRAVKAGIDLDPDNPAHKYDYRGAFVAGEEPEMSPEDGLYHWPSKFKDPDHPNRYVDGIDTITGEQYSDDLSSGYMLTRQLAHEVNSPAVLALRKHSKPETQISNPDEDVNIDEEMQVVEEIAATPAPVTEAQKKAKAIKTEDKPLEEPWIDPVSAGAGGFGGAGYISLKAGAKFVPSLLRAITSGIVGAGADYPIGIATEGVEEVAPWAALPFNVISGLVSGVTIENVIEKRVAAAVKAAGEAITPEAIGKYTGMVKNLLADESGEIKGDFPAWLRPITKQIKEDVIAEAPAEKVREVLKTSGVPEPGNMEQGAQDFLANKSPDITKEMAGNIRLWGGADLEPKFMGQIETPEDVMRVITATDDAFQSEREIARRGVQSWAATEEEAKKYKIEDLLGRRIGQAYNAGQIENARTMLVSSADTLRGMAVKVRSGAANDIEKMDFMRAFNVHYAIQMQVSGAAAEAGRALQMFRKVSEADTLRVGQIKDFLAGAGNTAVTPERLADALSTMESPAQVSAFVRQASRATTVDMLLEAWINGLLSGPTTHAVNTLSNSLVSLWMIPERLLAGGISKTIGSGEIKAGEATQQAFGLIQGFKDGMIAAGRYMWTGEGSDVFQKFESRHGAAITAENIKQLPVIKKLAPNTLEAGGLPARAVDFLGNTVRLPGRFLGAEDELFKSIGYRMELNALAYRKAVSEGLEGQAAAQRMQQIVSDPQTHAPEIQLAAIDAARYQTFTNALGEGGSAAMRLVNSAPALRLIVPFMKTPTNVFKFGIERTPIAPLMKSVRADIAAGGSRRDMALAKISFGSMVMATMATLAASGHITGGGPSDPAMKSIKRNTGWQSYSVKIGDKYYAYNRLEPLGMLIGFAADTTEIMTMAQDTEDRENLASAAAVAIGKNVTSKTWLRGVSELISALDDPDRYGQRYLQNYARTLIPTGIAQIERELDPEIRAAYSMIDSVKSRTPGYSKDLPPMRNLWGEPIVPEGGIGPDFMSPIYTSTAKKSPIDEELLRMKVPLKKPSKTQSFEGVRIDLTPTEYDRYQLLMNREKLVSTNKTLKQSLDYLVTKDSEYKRASDEQKEMMIRGLMVEAREISKVKLINENIDLKMIIDEIHTSEIGR